MKKIVSVVSAGLLLFGVSVYAEETEHQKEASLPYYVTLKGAYTFGEKYKEEDGQAGYGIGIDLGYEFAKGFSIELDGTYEKADIDADDGTGAIVTESADYYATSLDLVYVYEMTEKLGLLAKAGFEYEYEKIGEASTHDTGASFALGLEYVFDHAYNGVIEYETSTTDGPKGDAVMAGVKFKF